MSLSEFAVGLPPELQHLQTRFMAAVEHCAIFLLDPNGHILSWNRGAEIIKGWRADEVIGQHFSCLYPAADTEAGTPRSALEAAAALGRFEEIGDRVRKDGSRFLAETVITAIRGPDGSLQGFGTMTRDITEQAATESIAKANEARLRSLIETVLDTVVDGLVTIDRNGIIQSFNKACVGLFGYAADEVIGQNVRVLMPEPYHS